MEKCKECGKDFTISDTWTPGFCDKWCDQKYADKTYEKIEMDDNRLHFVHTFKPYYNQSHNVQVNTASEHRALIKKHGAPLGDYTSLQARSKFVRKNKEDIIYDRYSQMNLKYPRGEDKRFDEKNNRFVSKYQFSN